jgi:ABC-type polysaccharide/polyol phosphate export permease
MLKYILKNTLSDYKNSYKSSFLSYSWVIIHPLLLLVIYSFVFSTILQPRVDPNHDISYTLYLSVAILPWIVFSNTILQGTLSISNNIHLIKKLNIPIYVYVTKEVLEQFLNMFVVIILLIGFLYLNDISFSLKWLLSIIPFVCLFFFALGLSMFLASINIFFRDIEKAIGIFLQMMMWVVPIVYPWDIVPENFQWVIFYDPLFYFFNSIREVLIFNHLINIQHYVVMIVSSILMFGIGLYTINKLESDIRDSI